METESLLRRALVATLATGVVLVSGSAFGFLFFPASYAPGPYVVFFVGFLLPGLLESLSRRWRT